MFPKWSSMMFDNFGKGFDPNQKHGTFFRNYFGYF